MAESNIAVFALKVSPGASHNLASWMVTDPNVGGPEAMQLDYVELWASQTDSVGTGTPVANGVHTAVHAGLAQGATWYYWIRGRNKGGAATDFHPLTNGVQATVGGAGASEQPSPLGGGKLIATAAANALTMAVVGGNGQPLSAGNPLTVNFRDSAGGYVTRTVTTPLSLTIPSGSSFGQVANQPFKLWAALFDHAGTVRLAAGVRASSTQRRVFPLAETGTANATSGQASIAGGFYSPVTISGAQFRTIGYAEFSAGLPVAGVYSTAPSSVRLYGTGVPLPGQTVQQVHTATASVQQFSSPIIPFDNTIPQSFEGSTILLDSVGLVSAAHFVEAAFVVHCSHNAVLRSAAALFRGAEADAVAVAWGEQAAINKMLTLSGEILIAGNALAQIFSVRIGSDGAGSLTLNGVNGAALFGGALRSSLKLKEIAT